MAGQGGGGDRLAGWRDRAVAGDEFWRWDEWPRWIEPLALDPWDEWRAAAGGDPSWPPDARRHRPDKRRWCGDPPTVQRDRRWTSTSADEPRRQSHWLRRNREEPAPP